MAFAHGRGRGVGARPERVHQSTSVVAAALALGGILCLLVTTLDTRELVGGHSSLLVMRLGAGMVLLLAAWCLLGAAQRRVSADAVVVERRRIAHDLHDGLAQDLAYIALHSERLASQHGDEHPVVIAARRALAVSRGHISDLEARHAPSAEAAIREVAGEFRARYGVEVAVAREADEARDGLELPGRSELVRIAREAIANAVRHGGAQRIDVRLGGHDDDVLLRVSDDGHGFDGAVASTAGTGLGMRTMHDRARRIGADLSAGATSSGGARIEVTAPRARR